MKRVKRLFWFVEELQKKNFVVNVKKNYKTKNRISTGDIAIKVKNLKILTILIKMNIYNYDYKIISRNLYFML